MSYSFHRYTALTRCTAQLQQLCRIRDGLPRADVAEDVEPSDAVVGRDEECWRCCEKVRAPQPVSHMTYKLNVQPNANLKST